MKWVPWDPSNIFLVTSFTWKRPESSDFMYSSIFMLENIWHLKLREGHMHSLQVPEAKRNENKKKKAKCCCFYPFLLRRFGKKFNGYLSFLHCIKSVSIRSYSGPYFPTFWPEQLRIRTLFTKCSFVAFQNQPFTGVLYNRSSEKNLKNAWGCHEAHFYLTYRRNSITLLQSNFLAEIFL